MKAFLLILAATAASGCSTYKTTDNRSFPESELADGRETRAAFLVTAEGERIPMHGTAIEFPMPNGDILVAELLTESDQLRLSTEYSKARTAAIVVHPGASNLVTLRLR